MGIKHVSISSSLLTQLEIFYAPAMKWQGQIGLPHFSRHDTILVSKHFLTMQFFKITEQFFVYR